MMNASFGPHPKSSIFDSAQHHMHACQKYGRYAARFPVGSERNVGYARKAEAHRKAANLIFAFIDSKRVGVAK